MKRAILCGVALVAIAASTSYADNYVGGSVLIGEYQDRDTDFDIETVNLRLGTELSEVLAVEARAGLGIGDDRDRLAGVRVRGEVDNYVGAYVLAGVPTDTPVYPYALFGYTRAETKLSGRGNDSHHDYSFGLGVSYQFNRDLDFSAEYVQYINKSSVKIDGLSLGAKLRF